MQVKLPDKRKIYFRFLNAKNELNSGQPHTRTITNV